MACQGSRRLDAHLHANQPSYTSARGLTTPAPPPVPMPPMPASLLAVRVDAGRAQRPIEQVGKACPPPPCLDKEGGRHHHVRCGQKWPAHAVHGAGGRLADSVGCQWPSWPRRFLLEDALQTASSQGQGSVAALPMFHDLAASAADGKHLFRVPRPGHPHQGLGQDDAGQSRQDAQGRAQHQ